MYIIYRCVYMYIYIYWYIYIYRYIPYIDICGKKTGRKRTSPGTP